MKAIEKVKKCVCVCVCVRERERERERDLLRISLCLSLLFEVGVRRWPHLTQRHNQRRKEGEQAFPFCLSFLHQQAKKQ
jgi:hypothetical protein